MQQKNAMTNIIKFIATILVLCLIPPSPASAQGNAVHGNIFDTGGDPLAYATAVLLNPADSTLLSYAISDERGAFRIPSVSQGEYLLQVAFMGYETLYRRVSVPADTKSPFVIAMEALQMQLGEVEIVGEAVPILINGDTVEYKRAAYKLQEGAVVEDLLRKLPGVEVDRTGNIRAMGEDVQQVYVDGKEFFGKDPKMATKNIPAEAVDKVQMFDKKSDDADFTGVDDGSREKSLNIVMEEDMKHMLFGDVSAGGGMPSVYQGRTKAFYHTEKLNFAALGNLNNINEPGFSFSDYMNFRGGSLTLMTGSGPPPIGGSGSFPVNFGQTVYGENTSGTGGVNISHGRDKFNMLYINYMGNFVLRMLEEERNSRNYTSQAVFEKQSSYGENKADTVHIVNFGLKRRPDSMTSFSANFSADINAGGFESAGSGASRSGGKTINERVSEAMNATAKKGISGNTAFTRILDPGKTILKLNGNGSFARSFNMNQVLHTTSFFEPFSLLTNQQYQSNAIDRSGYGASTVLIQKVGKYTFLEPGVTVGGNFSTLTREQGATGLEESPVDSLSPAARHKFLFWAPILGIRINNDDNKFNFRIKYQFSQLATTINDNDHASSIYRYLLPLMNYEHIFSTGRRLNISYEASMIEPELLQRIPLINTLDPLYQVKGNPQLEPEYRHSFNAHLFIFDQFSFTSLFAGFRAAYTTNSISMSRTINDQFVQTIIPVNVDQGLTMGGSVDFSTPIRRLGVKVRLRLDESFSKGLSLVNDTENAFTSVMHDVMLSFENRMKKQWDLKTGAGLRLTDSKYSLQDDLNDVYYDLNWFGEATYTPTEFINFTLIADVINYNQRSFSESVMIPYLKGEINFYIPPSRRSSLKLSVNDILNRDRGIQRISELNYLAEVRRNILGRYAMLTFSYKLNKAEKQDNNIEIEVNSGRRR